MRVCCPAPDPAEVHREYMAIEERDRYRMTAERQLQVAMAIRLHVDAWTIRKRWQGRISYTGQRGGVVTFDGAILLRWGCWARKGGQPGYCEIGHGVYVREDLSDLVRDMTKWAGW